MGIVSKDLTLLLPLFIWLFSIPETISTPMEYAAPTAKLAHRLLIIHINNLYSFTLWWWEANIVKCLAQEQKCHNRDSNTHSDSSLSQQKLSLMLYTTWPQHSTYTNLCGRICSFNFYCLQKFIKSNLGTFWTRQAGYCWSNKLAKQSFLQNSFMKLIPDMMSLNCWL